MPREDKLIVCASPELKKMLPDWSDRWFGVRQRHPFFLMHAGNSEINESTVELIKKYVSAIQGMPIDVIIHSPGGQMRASFKATVIFQSICDYVAVVPKYAKSGATLFSLGASEIILGKWAELGPLDPQVESFSTERKYWREQESALESFHAARYAQREVTEQFNIFIDFLINIGLSGKSSVQDAIKLIEATIGKIYANVSSFELGSSGRILDAMDQYCLRVLQKSYPTLSEPRRKRISKHLVWEYLTHDFYIDREEASKIGLRVSEAPTEIQQLLDELENEYGNSSCWGIALLNRSVPGTKAGANGVGSSMDLVRENAGEGNGKH